MQLYSSGAQTSTRTATDAISHGDEFAVIMPHKHKRTEKDLSTFDLPPTEIAKPLPVTSISKKNLPEWNGIQDGKKPAKQGADKEKKSTKRKRKDDKKDDMPRAFKRLMAFADGKKPRGGLDDGVEPSKKKKQPQKKAGDAAVESTEGATPAKQVSAKDARPEIPTIRPGERLSEYAQRVDAALPLSGLVTKTVKNGKDPLGLKVVRTRKEKKMHKLYDQWREEERKIQEKREEEAELAEEEEMENETMGVKWKMDMEDEMANRKKKKKGKKGTRYLGEVKEKEEDPWEELKKKRAEPKIGLHDVAAAPPELIKVNPKLLVRGAQVNVGDIPKSAGSLRQREELQAQRDDVVAAYRKLMSEKRPAFGPTHNYRRT